MKLFFALTFVSILFVNSQAFCEEIKAAPPIPEAKKNVADGKAVLVDVREKSEFDEGHLAAARLIPLSDLKNGTIPADLKKDALIYTYCKVGGRATEAAKILIEKGYKVEPLQVKYVELAKEFETK